MSLTSKPTVRDIVRPDPIDRIVQIVQQFSDDIPDTDQTLTAKLCGSRFVEEIKLLRGVIDD